MPASMGPSQPPARRTPHMRSPAFVRPPSASTSRPPSSSSGSSSSSTSTLTSASSANLIKAPRNDDGRPTQGGQGYFEPSLATPSASTVAAAAALRDSARKRSMTDPALSTPSTTGSSSGSSGTTTTVGFGYPPATNAANAAALAVMPKVERNPSTTPSEAPSQKGEKKESKMKLFSKPRLTGSSSSSKLSSETSSRPIPSPSKFTSTGSPITRMATSSSVEAGRRPSFTQAFSDNTPYSSSPPTHSHHKHHLLLRSRKDPMLSSASSNSKATAEGGSMYSFAPSSPSSAAFSVGVGSVAGQSQKSLVSAYDLKHVVGVSSKDKDQAVEQVLEDVWPTLKSRVLLLFAGEGLRTPVEDLNKLVVLHIKRQVDRQSAILLIDDTRSVLDTGMTSLDNNLSKLPDERLVPRLVEIWNFVFSNVLPYFEAVFLPLQQEFKGIGTVMTAREARDVWGVTDQQLDIRRMTLISYRDNVVLPLHGRLRIIFSKLQLDFDALPNVTETVGRVLQCVSVLASVLSNDDKQAKMDELAKTLKHNWLSRGRTGRNRRGFVGTKTRVLGNSQPTSATGSMVGGVMI